MSAIDFTPFLIIPGLVLLAWFTRRQIIAFHASEHETRADQRIPAEELRLTGLDYREPVADYFRRRFESKARTRHAIAAVCGTELPSPQTQRSRTATTAGSPNTRRNPDVGVK